MSKKKNSTTINCADSAVALDKKGARYIAQAFRFPDGSPGMAVIINVKNKTWECNIETITIDFKKDENKTS